MKSLDQVEPRSTITNLPFFISQPGAYYATTNLVGSSGITIASGGVTVDLMGFEMVGGSGNGFYVSLPVTNVTIRNGSIRNWLGTAVSVGNARNCRLEQLAVTGNTDGISAGPGSIVEDCLVSANGASGIDVQDGCNVRNCVSRLNWFGINTGKDCVITGCNVSSNQTYGISTDTGCLIQSCDVNRNAQRGINSGNGATILGCNVRGNGSDGISAGNSSLVAGCLISQNASNGVAIFNYSTARDNNSSENGGAGILAFSQRNRVEGNHVALNKRGIEVTTSSLNLIIRNSASGNPSTGSIGSSNYVFIGAVFGPTNNLVGIGGVVTNENPWANFSY